MSTLKIYRPHDGGGLLRRLVVEVDGTVVARLKQGESVNLTVTPGSHQVQGRMDWTTSPKLELDVGPDEEAMILVQLPLSALWNMLRKPKEALLIEQRLQSH